MADFLRSFKPRFGDVLYGISPARNAYLSDWREDRLLKSKNQNPSIADPALLDLTATYGPDAFYTMDTYNNYYSVPSIGDVSKSEAINALREKYDMETNDYLKAYYEKLTASRFSAVNVFDAHKAKLAKEGYRRQHFNASGWFKDKKRKKNALAQNRNYLAIRRACKFGIGLVATDPAFPKARVHFVLDGLDMEEVATKGMRTSTSGVDKHQKTFVSITVSELRHVYRNWGVLNGRVHLYVNKSKVEAPWITDWEAKTCIADFEDIESRKDLWDEYGEHRKQKYAVDDLKDIMKQLL